MKQRLVGSVVLICVAVIIVPMLLDGDGVNAPELNVAVPPAPVPLETPTLEVPTGELPTPVLPPAPDPSGSTVAGQGPEAETTDDDNPEEVAQADSGTASRNDDGLLQGWSVRLGTFGDAGNADSLMRDLRAGGHKAYTRLIRRDSGDLTAVLVGPVLSRDEARQLRDELADDFDLDPMVVEYEVTSVESAGNRE